MNQLLTVLLFGGQQAAAQGGQGGNSWMTIVLFGLVIVVFYFFMIRPGQKKAKEERQFRDSLAKGNKVITNSGLFGKIVEINEGNVIIEIAEGVKIKILKSAIMSHYDGSLEEKERKEKKDDKGNEIASESGEQKEAPKNKNKSNIILIIILVVVAIGAFVYIKWFKKDNNQTVEKINIDNIQIKKQDLTFTYTGEATKDSIPLGKGTARFSSDSTEDRLSFVGEWKLSDTVVGILYFKDTIKYKAITDTFYLKENLFSYNKIQDSTEIKNDSTVVK